MPVVLVLCDQHIEQRALAQLVPLFEEHGAHTIGLDQQGVVFGGSRTGQIALRQGESLSRADAAARPIVSRVDPHAVGSWEAGSLQYDDATLDRVARDLSRNLGRPIATERRAAALRFTGTLSLAGTPSQVLARAGPLLGVTFTPEGDGWTMHRDDGAHR